jgi:2-hydroxy-6-oxonona-2,4-dienedioate hydrolase
VHDERSIAGGYFEDIMRFHYIKGTNRALLRSLRNNFFDKLLNEIHIIGRMRIPSLIVWGRHDHTIPLELGQHLHEILKGSRLQILEESAHCPNYEEPEKFNAIVSEFLLD